MKWLKCSKINFSTDSNLNRVYIRVNERQCKNNRNSHFCLTLLLLSIEWDEADNFKCKMDFRQEVYCMQLGLIRREKLYLHGNTPKLNVLKLFNNSLNE